MSVSGSSSSSLPVLVKYLAVGRLARGPDGQFKADKHQIIASALAKQNDPAAKNYKSHVKAIMTKGAAKLQAGKRIRLTSDNNDYDLHVVSDLLDEDETKPIVFFAVTDPDFAKSHSIAGLLKDLKDGFYQACNSADIAAASGSSGPVNRQAQGLFNKLFNQYGSSKLAAVQGKVDEVKDVMKQNVQRALDNVEKLEEIEVKSEEFEQQARMFQKDSSKVNRMMRCRYYKITALIVLVVGVILTIIIVPIVQKAKSNN